jgi:hypothetical protein
MIVVMQVQIHQKPSAGENYKWSLRMSKYIVRQA